MTQNERKKNTDALYNWELVPKLQEAIRSYGGKSLLFIVAMEEESLHYSYLEFFCFFFVFNWDISIEVGTKHMQLSNDITCQEVKNHVWHF